MAKQPLARHKSRGVSEVADPRAARTRARICAAFTHFIGRRPYARIRVGDLTRKAQVGRATFYAHFPSKDALLHAELERIMRATIVPLPDDPCHADCTALFAHLQHARDIYRSLMAGESRLAAERVVHAALEERIAQILLLPRNAADATPVAPTFVPRFIAATLLALIAWSLEQAQAPAPAKLQELFRSLVGPAAQLAL